MSFIDEIEAFTRQANSSYNTYRDRFGDMLENIGLGIRRTGAKIQRTGRGLDGQTDSLMGVLPDDFQVPGFSRPAYEDENTTGQNLFGLAVLGTGLFLLYAAMTEK